MKIQHVPPEYVNQVWLQVSDFVQAAIDNQEGEGDYTLDQVRTFVTAGKWMLVVATTGDGKIRGCAIVNFFNRPNHRVAFITHIGGKLVTSPDTFNQFRTLLVTFGATSIEGAVNDAVARLWRRYGFIEKYRIVEVKL
jgi:hypothetical protein